MLDLFAYIRQSAVLFLLRQSDYRTHVLIKLFSIYRIPSTKHISNYLSLSFFAYINIDNNAVDYSYIKAYRLSPKSLST
jgi:hypothetical protein